MGINEEARDEIAVFCQACATREFGGADRYAS
jgi:hypothetical protein